MSTEQSTLSQIYWLYERAVEGLQRLERAAPRSFGPDSLFYGLTPREFEHTLRAMKRELDHEASLALIASAEATLRLDYHERVKRRRKLPIGVRRAFRALEERCGNRVALPAIVAAWSDELGMKPSIHGEFCEYLRLRHWLAHGRWWSLKTACRPEPDLVLAMLQRLFAELAPQPGFPAT